MAEMMKFVLCLFINFLLVSSEDFDDLSYDALYQNALEAYWNDNWKGAVGYFEQALASYKQYKTGVLKCHRKCKDASSSNNFLNDLSVGKIANKALCTRKCHDEEFGDFRKIIRISPESKKLFEDLLPYAYLQFAYFQVGDLAKSVSAAYTYNERFPDDKLMQANMDYYRDNENVTEDMYINMEPRPHLEKYDLAVQAYLKEDYTRAAELFEESLQSYYEADEECQALCEGEDAIRRDESDELDFYMQNADHYIQVLECHLQCMKNLTIDSGKKETPEFLSVQYHFLQFAYYQLKDYVKGAVCAKTYLMFYPNDEVMVKNMDVYGKDVAVDELKPREDAFLHRKRVKSEISLLKYAYQNFGMRGYDSSLLELFPEEKPDQVKEEGEEMKQEENEEEAEANEGSDELKDAEEEVKDDSDISDIEEDDSDPDEEEDPNEPYSSFKEKTDDIIKHKDAAMEKVMLEREKKKRDEENYAEPEDDVDISYLSLKDPGYQTVDSKYMVVVDERSDDEEPLAEGPMMYEGTVLLANSSQLKGRSRFAVDGLSTEEECLELIDLELSFGVPGDGYGGKSSPHSVHEKFEGVNVLAAAELAKDGVLPLRKALLYYDLSEKARAQVQAYFNLPQLYFDYTHLVCRTAKPNSPTSRDDLSHPVHADNCLLKSNGECVKERPAYTWRDYSAILYLNNDFEGGEFLFTDSTARRIRTLVKPKCGRMVSFGAGPESFHGVKPIINGQRCAVALWFTMSQSNDEKQRIEAKKILDELKLKQKDEL